MPDPGPPHALFLRDLPDVDFEGHNVILTYRSGGQPFERIWTRSNWRRFLEREIRRLNATEAAEQGRVVPLKASAAGRRAKGESEGQRA